jgi:hypothetical protein
VGERILARARRESGIDPCQIVGVVR